MWLKSFEPLARDGENLLILARSLVLGEECMFAIHPSAEESFNSKVNSLVNKVKKVSRESQSEPEFESEIHISATISSQDIIGDINESITDYRGKKVGRLFMFEGERYGLLEADHVALVDVAEKIQRQPAFRERLSQGFVEESIFSWIKKTFTKEHEGEFFILSLIESAKKIVKPITVYIPIANLVVQRPFSFCGAEICNISKALVDEISTLRSDLDERQKPNVIAYFERFRKDYQGYSAVRLNLVCEPEHAADLAVVTAQKVTSFLGIFSKAMLLPDVKCVSRIKGTENLAQSTTISRTESGGFIITKSILDAASDVHWNISEATLEDYEKLGLGILSSIAVKDKPTEFESVILNTSLLYSKAAFTAEPLEKLVYMLSALESTLLKNENEPIQQNLAERIALFTSQELVERKSIIKNVKYIYGLRSRYLHHGHSSSEQEELSTFFFRVWLFYFKLLMSFRRFSSKSDFLEAIDDQKFG